MMNSPQEAELRARLIDSIVAPEVISPMEANNWNHANYTQAQMTGQPGAPAPSPNAALPGQTPQTDYPPAAAPAGVQAQHNSLDFEQFRDPQTGLYAGKYTSPEELVKGMKNVVTMAKQALQERDELKAKLNTISPPPQQYSEPVVDFPPPTNNGVENLDRVLNQIVSEGGFLDESNSRLLRDAVIELADSRAKNLVSSQTHTQTVWDEVSDKMEERYPGSSNRADELHLYVKSDPALTQAVTTLIASGKEFEATEMAWRLMTNALPVSSPALTPAHVKEVTLQAQDAVRQEAVDAARKDAGVFTTTGGGIHESPSQEPSLDEIAQAAAIGRKTADWTQWRRAALGKFIDFNSPMFNG